MTEKEAIEFFEEVKGKKIRYTDLPIGNYFIPNILGYIDLNTFTMKGVLYNGTGIRILDIDIDTYIFEGFSLDKYNGKWEFVEENQVNQNLNNSITPIKTCTCSSRDLFNYGCRCGGK